MIKRELSDLRLACGVLREPFAWWVMMVSLACTALVFSLLAWLVWWLVRQVPWLHQGWFASTRWDEWLMPGMGVILVVLVGWFTFPLIVTAVAGGFLEPLADRIERRHYPTAPTPRQVPLSEQIHSSLRVLLRGLGWNLVALPCYFIPVVNVIVYAWLNSFLLSREYFQVVAVRHVSLDETKELYRAHRGSLLRGGLVLAVLFVVPVLNLCAPLLATAWMVHRVWRGEDAPLRRKLV
ncbi:MAG: EI24 domain-containing protein [Verrucomicrobia bacterium]|nr:EI24 domain-containing protein [Verrucomicrobiota bacterium]